jgi:hypothetical protein
MHLHIDAAFDTTDPDNVYVVNHPTAYTITPDIETLVLDSGNVSLSNRYYNLVIWRSVSSGSEEEQVFINLPSGSYKKQSDAENDVSGYDNFAIPTDYRGYAYLVQRVTIKHSTAGGGTWTIHQQTDLRGTVPSLAVGGGTLASTTEFADSAFKLFDEGDPTRELAFQLSGIAAGNTREVTAPDKDLTLIDLADAIAAVEGEDTLLLSGNVGIAKSFSLSGDISPSQLTANTNNWDPTGLADASVIRVSTDASRDLTGIVPKSPDDGRILIIHNIGAQDLVLKDASGSSSAANRFALSGDITLAGDDAVTLQYDTTSNRWRAIGSSPGGAGGGGQDLDSDTLWAARGDLAKGTGDDAADILSIGADHTILVSDGSDPLWSAIPPLAGIADTGDTTRIALATSVVHVTLTGETNVDGHLAVQSATGPNATRSLGIGPPDTLLLGLIPQYWLQEEFSVTVDANNAILTGVGGVAEAALDGTARTGVQLFGLDFQAKTSGGTAGSALTSLVGARLTAFKTGTMTAVAMYGLWVNRQANTGTGDVTDKYGVLVANMADTKTLTSYALYIADQTGANTAHGIYIEDADDYAIWVDAGLSRFDGDGSDVFELPADATDPTSGGGAAAGRIPVKIGGVTKYLAYY